MHKQPNNQAAAASQPPLSLSLPPPCSSSPHCSAPLGPPAVTAFPSGQSPPPTQNCCFYVFSLRRLCGRLFPLFPSSTSQSQIVYTLPLPLHCSSLCGLSIARVHTRTRASVMTGCAIVCACVRARGEATPSSVVHSTCLNGCLVLQLCYDGHHFRGMLRVWQKIKTSVPL